MKVPGEYFSGLLIPFLGLGSNNTQSHYSLSASDNRTSPAGLTGTFSANAPLQTRHHHHEERGEGGALRPRAGSPKLRTGGSHGKETSTACPQPPVLSCSPKATSMDSCCVVTPGGVLVHAQFWDLNVGVADSWGIHGLWPDKCNNQFYENCDSSRDYSGSQITSALQSAGQTSLLDFMNTYWVSNDESSPNFWAHEWKTHGTCVSTLEPSCLANYQTTDEVVPYFETVVNLFKELDTYKALAAANILPSDTATYALTDLQSVVQTALGFTPDFVCSSSTLTTVQYYLNAEGPLQDGQFVQSHASRSSSCPADGIQYPPKQLS